MWILILTMWAGSVQSGKAVEHIELNSRKACMVAAEMWLNSRPITGGNNVFSGPRYPSGAITALCVPKD